MSGSGDRAAELERQVVEFVQGTAPSGWRRIDLRCAATVAVSEVTVAVLTADGAAVPSETVPARLTELLMELRRAHYEPDDGTWFSALFLIEPGGRVERLYNRDFDPGWDPPIPAECFQRDQEVMPRAPDRMPAWLRARLDGREPEHRPEPAAPEPLDPIRQTELVTRDLAVALADRAPALWRRLHGCYQAVGDHIELPPVTVFFDDGTTRPWAPPAAVGALLDRLRAGMYAYGGATWSRFDFQVRFEDGRVLVDGSHAGDAEPAWTTEPTAEDVRKELQRFPVEKVPEWMSRRLAAASPQPAARTPRKARVFDHPGSDGAPPSVSRPPVAPEEIDRLADYLNSAPLVRAARSYAPDQLAPERGDRVPLTFHTDGTWVWAGAVGYYLREHGIPPEPDLVEHIRAQGFRVPEVDDAAMEAAGAALSGKPAAAPPPVDPVSAYSSVAPPGAVPVAGQAPPVHEPPQEQGPMSGFASAAAPPTAEAVPAGPEAGLVPGPSYASASAPDSGGAFQDAGPAANSGAVAEPEHASGQQPPHGAEHAPAPEAGHAANTDPAPDEKTPEPTTAAANDSGAASEESPAAERNAGDGGYRWRTFVLKPEGEVWLSRVQQRLEELGVDPSAYRLRDTAEGAWCLVQDGLRWAVFRYEEGERRNEAVFDRGEQAAAQLLGALLLVPRNDVRDAPATAANVPAAPPTSAETPPSTPLTIADVPPNVADAPLTMADVPPSTGDAPLTMADTPTGVADAQPINTPPGDVGAPLTMADVPPNADSPAGTAGVPLTMVDTPSSVADAPPANTPPGDEGAPLTMADVPSSEDGPAGTAGAPLTMADRPPVFEPMPGEPPLSLFRDKAEVELQVGATVDRFGEADGNVLYAARIPFGQRSLPPDWVDRPYHLYRVERPVRALSGVAIPWFDQPGGGTAYVFARSVGDLVADGVLAEVRDVPPPPG
ncbi:UNVERIFIED_ORG: uncharacterized protein DUF4237 [Actinomadura viridilutea]|uniref:glycohydrolase toxin TNT-related protein n=1 Tax=Actinomadura rubrobrunea TaxID=115335 RepID=UPI000D2D1C96|nr:glycohydrolase toxin TNT-related protein [Actinomadura rubrobrunea]